MVVIRGVSPDAVRPLVEGLIAAISHHPYDLGNGTSARIGASIGFACLPEDAVTAVELRVRADQALYVAKGSGKGLGLRYREAVEATAGAPVAGEIRSSFTRLEQRKIVP